MNPRFTMNNRMGGSSFLSHTLWAAMLLELRLADTVLICYGSNQRTASGKLMTALGLPTYEAPYRPLFPLSSYALATDRHMTQFGTTREQLADVAVAARGLGPKEPRRFHARSSDARGCHRLAGRFPTLCGCATAAL